MTRSNCACTTDRIILRLEYSEFVFEPLKDRQIDRVGDHKRSGHAVHLLKIRQCDGLGQGN